MSKVAYFFTRTIIPAAVLTIAFLLSVCNISCRTSTEDLTILEGDFSVPQIEEFSILGARYLKIHFNKEVIPSDIQIYDDTEDKEEIPSEIITEDEVQENDSTDDSFSETENEPQDSAPPTSSSDTDIIIKLEEETEIGQDYVVEGHVQDKNGNTLDFSIPFQGYNKNPASIKISEVRNAYGTATINKEKFHKSEFVELYVVDDGNLSGLEIHSASENSGQSYCFPPLEVHTGEYITVHMRTIIAEGPDGEGMINETTDDLTLSTHLDSNDLARDFWSDNTKAVFADNDIIYVLNSASGKIMDALLYSKSTAAGWKDEYKPLIEKIRESEIWEGGLDPENSVNVDDITTSATTRSISRQNFETNSKESWMIVADSGSGTKKIPGPTPGSKNSSNQYIKKTN